jgi:serine/threonine protein kinase
MSEPRLGPYRLLRKLSQGGMGAVYEGFNDAVERHVAIKVLRPDFAHNPDFVTRFFNEAKAANRIGHPSIVQIFDCGRLTDGTSYIVMELLHGETVGARVRRLEGRLPLLEALAIIRQVANALSAAHAKNIVHRDLKPDNIMLVPDPAVSGGERAKLLDFGIAKLRDPNLRKSLTKGDSLLGTPAYMSPEQCKGGVEVSDRADVYSLGVILYRLLAGRLPFLATGGGELLGMHQFQAPTPLNSVATYVPASVIALVENMMAKDPALRPSMAEVDQRVATLQQELAGFVQPKLPQPEVDPGASDDDEHEALTIDAGKLSESLPENLVFAPLATPITPQTPHPAAPSRSISLEDSASAGNRSTMNMLASENGSPPSRISDRKQPLLWVAIAVMILGAVGGGLLLGRSGQRPVSEQAGTPAGTAVGVVSQPKLDPEPLPRRIHWQIKTTPVSGEILRISDGAVLGRTPWQSEQIAGSGTQELRVVAPGYADKMVVLDLNRDEQQLLTLEPVNSVGTPPATLLPGKGAQKALKGDAHKKKKKPQFEIEE